METYSDFKKIDDNNIEVKKTIIKETTIKVDLEELNIRKQSLINARTTTANDWQIKDNGFAQQIQAIDDLIATAKENGVKEKEPKTVERKD